ncbi:MAG: PBSX family phage terminase large subunit [Oscillospiraceae bacterium]|nr:PBSX family phage terminase large subunit [Oscillospiraceae bacterium]
MPFSPKQLAYFREATHRWNIKSGATRSGKTHMDYYLIPKRIRAVSGKEGLTMLLGNTKGTLQRNIIEPLQTIWGEKLVSSIRSDNTATLFGEKVFCIGADKKSQVDIIRGSSIKYCYGDEAATWHEDVFTMLKSRLDKPYSMFDGTCNPEHKNHWFKKFIDSDSDVYCQHYSLDDNPFLDPEVAANIKKEYAGTVYYERYVKGLWVNAEGLIYRKFADNPKRYIISSLDSFDIIFATIGVDFGGGKSAHAFNCTAFTRGFRQIITIHDFRRKDAATPDIIYRDFDLFLKECRAILGNKVIVSEVFADSAEQTLIGGMRAKAAELGWKVDIRNARKGEINDRIRFYCIMQGADRYRILSSCKSTIEAFEEAMWDDKYITEDVRLDDGTTNIDNLDAQEYSTEKYMKQLIEIGGAKR